MDSPDWRIERLPITHPDAAVLVEDVQQEYVARYGSRDETPLDPTYFDPPSGALFVGYLDGRPVASGAWRRRSDVVCDGTTATAEVKRMYVAPAARRRGLARAMLAHLERTAGESGAEAMILETGLSQPEAIALYESSGYREIPGFGFYKDARLARCFARSLSAATVDVWDAEAAAFDDEPDHGLADAQTRGAWRELLLEALPTAPARVADLGCGTGTLSLLLAEAGYSVEGLDSSVAMVRRAREKAAAAGQVIPFRVADAGAPPLRPGCVEAVLVRHVLWALPDPVEAVRRWAALLAPGGRLVLVEGDWHTGAGLTASRTCSILAEAGLTSTLTPLTDPILWGGPITDERYRVVGTVLAPAGVRAPTPPATH